MRSNYIIEDEIEDSQETYTPEISKSKNTKKNSNTSNYLIIGVAILIVMVFIILIAGRKSENDKYYEIEKAMYVKSQDYIENNPVLSFKETYLDVGKLGVELPNDCSLLSGVIYNEGKHQPNLICSKYKSKLNNNNEIKLFGNEMMFIQKGSSYYELGYDTKDDVSISGHVNTEEAGVYNVYYISKNSGEMSVRKVIVIDNPNLSQLFPVITVTNEEDKIEVGQIYYDDVTAIDRVDGNIGDKIIKMNNVNENEEGVYKNVYSITNSLGYTTMASQNIMVLNSLEDEETSILASINDESVTNGNVQITIKIIGNNYDHLVLPDETTSIEKDLYYEVEENGDYLFTAVNADGTTVSKTVRVSNIDKTIPEGTCKALLYSTKTMVSVNISSFNYVVGYNYIINGNETGFISNSYYNHNKAANGEVSVMLRDYIGNENRITCTTEKKYSYDPNGYQDKTYTDVKARLRDPIGEVLARRGYTINDLNKCIYDRVQEAGPGTRYGVAAAGYGLIDCMYKMAGVVGSYDHTGGKVEGDNYCRFNSDICGKLGVNSRWGHRGGSCTKDECWYGLNCATFVGWAMCNGGMDLCTRRSADAYGMTSTTYFPEADGVAINGRIVKYYSGDKNLVNLGADQLVRMLKPGDAIASSAGNGHTFLVVGKDSNGIYTAEDGYFMRYLTYDKLVKGDVSYRLLFLDKYYDNPKNRNNLYG